MRLFRSLRIEQVGMNIRVLMIGDSLDCQGGISAVVRSYRDGGIFESLKIDYVSNYDGPGLVRQISVMSRTLMAIKTQRKRLSLIHIHSASRGGFWRALAISCVARLFHIAYILHIHSGEFLQFYEKECGHLRRSLIRWAFFHSACIICLTPGWRKKLATIAPQASYVVVPNPVSIPKDIDPNEANAPYSRLLYMGRLIKKKGIFDLLVAFAEVVKKIPSIRLVVAGNGDEEAIKQCIRRLGICEQVSLSGWVEGAKKDSLFRESTILVAPSHYEAFGVSVVEGLAYGKPVVACRVGGIPEVMIDGVHGLLVAPQAPRELADRIYWLCMHPSRVHEMGAAGRQHVMNHFSLAKVAKDLSNCYQGATSVR